MEYSTFHSLWQYVLKRFSILDHTRGVLEKGMEVYTVSRLTRDSCEEARNKRRHQGPFHAVLVLV